MGAGLNFVYVGNVLDEETSSTDCPDDGTLFIRRLGFVVLENRLQQGCCPSCGRTIPGVWL